MWCILRQLLIGLERISAHISATNIHMHLVGLCTLASHLLKKESYVISCPLKNSLTGLGLLVAVCSSTRMCLTVGLITQITWNMGVFLFERNSDKNMQTMRLDTMACSCFFFFFYSGHKKLFHDWQGIANNLLSECMFTSPALKKSKTEKFHKLSM